MLASITSGNPDEATEDSDVKMVLYDDRIDGLWLASMPPHHLDR